MEDALEAVRLSALEEIEVDGFERLEALSSFGALHPASKSAQARMVIICRFISCFLSLYSGGSSKDDPIFYTDPVSAFRFEEHLLFAQRRLSDLCF